MNKIIMLGIVFIMLATFVLPVSAESIIGLIPSSYTVEEGETFYITVFVDSNDSQPAYGWKIENLTFDYKCNATEVNIIDYGNWTSYPNLGVIHNDYSYIWNIWATHINSSGTYNTSDNVTAARINFIALSPGIVYFNMSGAGTGIWDELGNFYPDVVRQNTKITIDSDAPPLPPDDPPSPPPIDPPYVPPTPPDDTNNTNNTNNNNTNNTNTTTPEPEPENISTNINPVASIIKIEKNIIEKTATFNGSGSYDLDGYIVSYNWDFGDGLSDACNCSTISHNYAERGIYIVSLNVTDNNGTSNITSFSFKLEYDGEPAPVVTPDINMFPISLALLGILILIVVITAISKIKKSKGE